MQVKFDVREYESFRCVNKSEKVNSMKKVPCGASGRATKLLTRLANQNMKIRVRPCGWDS